MNKGYDKKIKCKLYHARWLHIVGKVDIEDLKEVMGKDINVIKRWWRSKRLLAVYGRVKKFRLESDEKSKNVVLYLENIRLRVK